MDLLPCCWVIAAVVTCADESMQSPLSARFVDVFDVSGFSRMYTAGSAVPQLVSISLLPHFPCANHQSFHYFKYSRSDTVLDEISNPYSSEYHHTFKIMSTSLIYRGRGRYQSNVGTAASSYQLLDCPKIEGKLGNWWPALIFPLPWSHHPSGCSPLDVNLFLFSKCAQWS